MSAAGGSAHRGGGGRGSGSGLRQRIGRWFPGREDPPPPLVDDGTLVVVGRAFDPAQADSAVVEAMRRDGVDVSGPLLLRHHLHLPDAAAVAAARHLLGPDGYAVTAHEQPDGVAVLASRPQVVTGLAAAQERTRMAGLAQRLGGGASGWDALAPPPAAEPP